MNLLRVSWPSSVKYVVWVFTLGCPCHYVCILPVLYLVAWTKFHNLKIQPDLQDINVLLIARDELL